ncbi:MAG: 3'-5' exonuclease [Chthoniobacterales bacterium]
MSTPLGIADLMAPVRHGRFEFKTEKDWAYAVNIIETVTWLAGEPDYLDELRGTIASLHLFDRTSRPRSKKVFEWLAAAMSYQGISDEVARTYMAEYGRPRWRDIAHGVKRASCPLLQSYWQFYGCCYRKSAHTCTNPHLIGNCPLPTHSFRNGNLNQLAYSFFLFIRDVAKGDLVGWLDARLADAEPGPEDDRLARMAEAIIGPLTGVHGISHKVLNMALADLMIVCNLDRQIWGEVGGALIAVDTLVHNFLRRTGILRRAAKGLNARFVFIPGLEEQVFPGPRRRPYPGLIEEAARLLYVSITRARVGCVMSFARRRVVHGRSIAHHPSRFNQATGGAFIQQLNGLAPSMAARIVADCGLL